MLIFYGCLLSRFYGMNVLYLTWSIWLVQQQHVDTLYNQRQIFPLNVSRPCFLMSLQGMHKKCGLGTRLASSMKKCWTTQCKILCWLFGLLYKKVNACRLWVTAISVASFPDRFENAEKLMGLVSTAADVSTQGDAIMNSLNVWTLKAFVNSSDWLGNEATISDDDFWLQSDYIIASFPGLPRVLLFSLHSI